MHARAHNSIIIIVLNILLPCNVHITVNYTYITQCNYTHVTLWLVKADQCDQVWMKDCGTKVMQYNPCHALYTAQISFVNYCGPFVLGQSPWKVSSRIRSPLCWAWSQPGHSSTKGDVITSGVTPRNLFGFFLGRYFLTVFSYFISLGVKKKSEAEAIWQKYYQ